MGSNPSLLPRAALDSIAVRKPVSATLWCVLKECKEDTSGTVLIHQGTVLSMPDEQGDARIEGCIDVEGMRVPFAPIVRFPCDAADHAQHYQHFELGDYINVKAISHRGKLYALEAAVHHGLFVKQGAALVTGHVSPDVHAALCRAALGTLTAVSLRSSSDGSSVVRWSGRVLSAVRRVLSVSVEGVGAVELECLVPPRVSFGDSVTLDMPFKPPEGSGRVACRFAAWESAGPAERPATCEIPGRPQVVQGLVVHEHSPPVVQVPQVQQAFDVAQALQVPQSLQGHKASCDLSRRFQPDVPLQGAQGVQPAWGPPSGAPQWAGHCGPPVAAAPRSHVPGSGCVGRTS